MGKTPEQGTYRAMAASSNGDGNGHGGGSGFRYRRKVPASGKAEAKAAAIEDNQREATDGKRHEDGEDNQREHEQVAVAVAPLVHDDVGAGNQARDARKHKKKHKPRTNDGKAQSPDKDAGGKKDARRKSKRGGQTDKKGDQSFQLAPDKEINGGDAKAVESHRQPEVVVVVADASIDSNPRHGDARTTADDISATHDAADVLADAPTRAQYRQESSIDKHKRKQFARKGDKATKRRPKQLQWKVKAQQPPAHVAGATESSVSAATSDVIERVGTISESKKETDSVDEEVDFATRERQLLKLRAKSLSYPIESSSQETQSGSDDDSAMFIQFSRPLVPLPSSSIHTEDESEQARATATEDASSSSNVSFPVPFPLDRVAAITPAHVHEILISDFAFHPSEVRIDAGDVVVWHVSEQTPPMVEHCLEVTLMRASDAAAITASSCTLSAGGKFAWRFEDAGAVSISCSVYNAHGSIVVNGAEAAKPSSPARTSSKRKQARGKKQKKSKRTNGAVNSANGSATHLLASKASAELDGGIKDESESVEIFHCPPELLNHGGVPDMDAGLCQAVLSQLDAVANSAIVGVNASSGGVLPVIVVGDVACPVSEDTEQEADAGAAVIPTDDVEESNTDDEVADFQERVIAMLKHSEETQAKQRRSFVVDGSGFDALRAYEFLKRRFTDVQSGCERVVYL